MLGRNVENYDSIGIQHFEFDNWKTRETFPQKGALPNIKSTQEDHLDDQLRRRGSTKDGFSKRTFTADFLSKTKHVQNSVEANILE